MSWLIALSRRQRIWTRSFGTKRECIDNLIGHCRDCWKLRRRGRTRPASLPILSQHVPGKSCLRAFPTERKRTRERTVSFQSLLNCLDGVGTQDGVIVVATANDPNCLDPAILKRPGRFDRVVHFRNPDAELRRQYFRCA